MSATGRQDSARRRNSRCNCQTAVSHLRVTFSENQFPLFGVTRVRYRPYSLRRRVRRLPPRLRGDKLFPLAKARGWSTERRTSLPSCRALLWRTRAPLGAPWRLRASGFRQRHRLRVRVSWFPSRLLRFKAAAPVRLIGLSRLGPSETKWNGPSPASSSRRGPSAPRSGPGASRVRGYEPRPQAPHLAPSSKRLVKTPSAEPGDADYNPIRN